MNIDILQNSLKQTLISGYESKKEDKDYNIDNVWDAAKLGGLNPGLAISQGISVQDIEVITKLHNYLNEIISFSNETEIKDTKTLRSIGRHVQDIEFAMQDFWGFGRSSAHHTHWGKIKHCSCLKNKTSPYLDSNWGKEKSRSSNCPVHGVHEYKIDEIIAIESI
jgi:hypothetical protein